MVNAKSRVNKERPRVWIVNSTFALMFLVCLVRIWQLLP